MFDPIDTFRISAGCFTYFRVVSHHLVQVLYWLNGHQTSSSFEIATARGWDRRGGTGINAPPATGRSRITIRVGALGGRSKSWTQTPLACAALLDREKIRDCIAAVARGEDRRDAELIRASYWPHATCDYGIFTGSFPDYLDWVLPGSPAIVVTQHILGQILITLSGHIARSETHVIGYHRVDVGDGNIDTAIGGRYL